jgi:hypothetical protein
LNREENYPLARTNQIIALRDAGYLDGPDDGVHTLRRLPGLDDSAWSREARVRSYLAVNCANCHHPAGVERARWDASLSTPLSRTKILNGELLDLFGDPENRVVKPGDPEGSVLLLRMKQLGQGHMPPIGNTIVHQRAVELIEDWIREDLANYQTFEEWIALRPVTSLAREDDPDEDGASNYLEYLLSSDPGQAGDEFGLSLEQARGHGLIRFPQKANRGFELMVSSDLDLWKPLDLRENAPFFSATNRTGVVDFPIGPDAAFYKVRVYEP